MEFYNSLCGLVDWVDLVMSGTVNNTLNEEYRSSLLLCDCDCWLDSTKCGKLFLNYIFSIVFMIG